MNRPTGKELADSFQIKDVKPVHGRFNVYGRPGDTFRLLVDDGCCCPISAWMLGKPCTVGGIDSNAAAQQFELETGIRATSFWSGFDDAVQHAPGTLNTENSPDYALGVEVAEILGVAGTDL